MRIAAAGDLCRSQERNFCERLVRDDLSSRVDERSTVNLDGHGIDYDRFNATSIGNQPCYLKWLIKPYDSIGCRLIDCENWLRRGRWHVHDLSWDKKSGQ